MIVTIEYPKKKKTDSVYQFKITLNGTDPAIWRRIQVPGNYNFWDLHVAIQDAMGWQDYHLHHFEFLKPRAVIGIPDDSMTDDKTLPGWEQQIADWFPKKAKRILYRYDFGDDWEHTLQFEEVKPLEKRGRYPRCLEGKGACPPEDCGGIVGFSRFLEIMANPKHPEYKDMFEWYGRKFDPNNFKISDVLFDDPYERWQIALS